MGMSGASVGNEDIGVGQSLTTGGALTHAVPVAAMSYSWVVERNQRHVRQRRAVVIHEVAVEMGPAGAVAAGLEQIRAVDDDATDDASRRDRSFAARLVVSIHDSRCLQLGRRSLSRAKLRRLGRKRGRTGGEGAQWS